MQNIHHPFLIGAVEFPDIGGTLAAARKLSYAEQSLTVEDLGGIYKKNLPGMVLPR